MEAIHLEDSSPVRNQESQYESVILDSGSKACSFAVRFACVERSGVVPLRGSLLILPLGMTQPLK